MATTSTPSTNVKTGALDRRNFMRAALSAGLVTAISSVAIAGAEEPATAYAQFTDEEKAALAANGTTEAQSRIDGTNQFEGKPVEQVVKELGDIEAIRSLKMAYWDAVDSKNWDRLSELTTYFLPGMTGLPADVISSHQGHQSHIEITGETTAIGVISFEDNLFNIANSSESYGRGYYEDEYEKIDGRWVITSSVTRYIMLDIDGTKYLGADAIIDTLSPITGW